LLVTGKELLRREPDGSMVRHADLSGISSFGWNEIVVDGRGHNYVNSIQFGFLAREPPTAGIIALVTPDGTARQVAPTGHDQANQQARRPGGLGRPEPGPPRAGDAVGG
jgi:hypothetical protein